ncbi:hypothetical protein M427DRAFT_64947 [Gonapodya prolifera JEL478]|uniref:Uncharacterized protein n=1 Tax=Gonapodya prolifera (strain JEL478) TaxID=1344416 RepID=A0A138ZXG5_GONPJ|nr:hypothetical protein M427DRAFT_64947 [Gonapodya prolifera JEL478]|eukprot:KXS08985.1 hypothetical protein M427DRAFT_64947 [Gonapodya prolifera JEL478]
MSLPALSNDSYALHFPDNPNLVPITEPPKDGRSLDLSDWATFKIGIAEYPSGPTGSTVFIFSGGNAICYPDVRGGSPGTLMAATGGKTDAIVLTGGSCFGLEAATGVTAELLAQQGYTADWQTIPITRSAVVYDLSARPNTIYPDKALGRAAVRAARPGVFPMGRRGAGGAVSVGKMDGRRDMAEWAGQGGAYRNFNGVKIAVFTVVNAVGVIVDRSGTVVRGHFDAKNNRRLSLEEYSTAYASNSTTESVHPRPDGTPRNTTITLFVTNAKFESAFAVEAFKNVVKSVHASMARAIQPFHLLTDGDTFFGVTTNELDVEWTDLPPPAGDNSGRVKMSTQVLSYLGGELAWDAVLNSFDERSSTVG